MTISVLDSLHRLVKKSPRSRIRYTVNYNAGIAYNTNRVRFALALGSFVQIKMNLLPYHKSSTLPKIKKVRLIGSAWLRRFTSEFPKQNFVFGLQG